MIYDLFDKLLFISHQIQPCVLGQTTPINYICQILGIPLNISTLLHTINSNIANCKYYFPKGKYKFYMFYMITGPCSIEFPFNFAPNLVQIKIVKNNFPTKIIFAPQT